MTPLRREEYDAIGAMARDAAGLHLPEGKHAFVQSRLQRRLRHLGLAGFPAYLDLLRSAGDAAEAERSAFVSALTTNVTAPFREPHHFMQLGLALRDWRAARRIGARFHVWSAGCATGEEPLSMASTCRAILGAGWAASVRILATDVDRDVIARAVGRIAEGDGPLQAELGRLPPPLAAMASGRAAAGPATLAELSRGIEFLHHNLLDPLPHAETFDVVFCRNVTIYLHPDARRAAIGHIVARLAPGGLLAIGHSERLPAGHPGVEPAGQTAYRRRSGARPAAATVAACP